MLDQLDSLTLCCIFDELFRGTNSEERIAAYRVVKYITRHEALVFTATHEELRICLPVLPERPLQRTGERYGLRFDYKLKPGPATPHAIALLRYLVSTEITDQNQGELVNCLTNLSGRSP